ncbi:hypothetical protein [Brevibacillus parabrevis]|uniref:hypothetical protein n=1 Tax=Brevibacillus parabrevis TaxID=54914 RepID=UPI0009FD80B9|nr:hypothetical protein [Brevibacillus parabrevis]
MSRTIQFGPSECTLELSGWRAVIAFENRITLPYRFIKHVQVGSFTPEPGTLRMPGTEIPFSSTYAGRFLYGNNWYFLSFERTNHLLLLDLEGHAKYRKIVVQVENPAEIAVTLQQHLLAQHE